MSKPLNTSNVGELIKLLEQLIKEHPETKDYPIRVIEEQDCDEDGDAKPNYWLTFREDLEVSFRGQSGYEQSGEVRLIGGE